MDSGGIDFVEADFGSESAAGGGNVTRSPADWDKWSKQKFRTPVKPFIFMAITFCMLISLPWLLDCVQDLMLADKDRSAPQQAESTAAASSGAQQSEIVTQTENLPATSMTGQAVPQQAVYHSELPQTPTMPVQSPALPYQYDEQPVPQYTGPVHLGENGRIYAQGFQQAGYPQYTQSYQSAPAYSTQENYQYRPQRHKVVVSR